MFDKRIWINRTIELLEKNQDKIYWERKPENLNTICSDGRPKNEKNWENLSKNPNAISILEKNQDKIDWDYL